MFKNVAKFKEEHLGQIIKLCQQDGKLFWKAIMRKILWTHSSECLHLSS